MIDETQVNILKVIVDGTEVAHAELTVHDPEKAWLAFSTCFASMSPNIVGEVFEAMRLACNGGSKEPSGLTINITTQPRPAIYVPTGQPNGGYSLPPPPGGF